MRNLIIVGGIIGAVIAAASFFATNAPTPKEAVVNIYSYRQPNLIEPILAKFTAATGIKTQIIFAKKGLVERIRIEGAASPADILLTTDIGVLAGAADIAQPVASRILTKNIPAAFRDEQSRWFALTLRARIIYASRERVRQNNISLAELSNKKWRGRICMRSGQHPYNIALFAAMLAHLGEAEFKLWLQGLKNNLAHRPQGNDRAQVRNIYGGACDIAIGNTYYMGKMLTNEKQPEQKTWAGAVKLIFANVPNKGAHVNISGIALAKHAPNRANAIKFMEYLAGAEAQKLYAELNFEYPINRNTSASKLVQSWGKLTPDNLSMTRLATLRPRASKLVDEIGFNQ